MLMFVHMFNAQDIYIYEDEPNLYFRYTENRKYHILAFMTNYICQAARHLYPFFSHWILYF